MKSNSWKSLFSSVSEEEFPEVPETMSPKAAAKQQSHLPSKHAKGMKAQFSLTTQFYYLGLGIVAKQH
jgi:hypothetical protein